LSSASKAPIVSASAARNPALTIPRVESSDGSCPAFRANLRWARRKTENACRSFLKGRRRCLREESRRGIGFLRNDLLFEVEELALPIGGKLSRKDGEASGGLAVFEQGGGHA
jgi:hypothetical protein